MYVGIMAKAKKASWRLFALRLARKTEPNSRCLRRHELFPMWRGQRVDQLDFERSPSLLRFKYRGAIADAIADLGSPDDIRRLFAAFQQFLYQEAA